MDVELPDGTVVEGVPDGMSQRDLVSMLSKNGHDTSWYKAPAPGLIDRAKSALMPDPDRASIPSTADTINAPWTAPESGAINLPGSVMDGYTPPAASDQGMPIDAGMGPMRRDYHDTTRAGLIARPVQEHAVAAQGGGQVGKIAAASLSGRVDRLEHEAQGDTQALTAQEFIDDAGQGRTSRIDGELTSKEVLAMSREAQGDRRDESKPKGFDVFTNAVMRGIHNNSAMLAGLAAAGAKAAGADDLSLSLLKETFSAQAAAGKYGAQIKDFTHIENWSDVPTYALEGIVENAPQLIGSIGSGVVGGLVAKSLGAKVVAGMVREQAQKELLKRIAVGSAVGAGAASVGMETGSIYGDIARETGEQRPGVAAAFGVVAGALDAIPAFRAARTVLGDTVAKQVASSVVKRYGKEALIQLGAEGGTEFVQTLIEKGAVSYVDGQPVFTEKNMIEAVDAMLKGGIAGAAVGVGSMGIGDAGRSISNRNEDLTTGMRLDPSQADAAARQSLDPDNAQMRVASNPPPRAQPADILAAPTVDAAISAATDSLDAEFSDLLKNEQSDLAYLRRDSAEEATKAADFNRAKLQTEITPEQADALTRAQGFDEPVPTAMQLALQQALQRNPIAAPEEAPPIAAQPAPAPSSGRLEETAVTAIPSALSVTMSRRGSPVITGNAAGVQAAEPAIRQALPNISIIPQRDHDGGYALIVAKSADRSAVQRVIDSLNQGAQRGLQPERTDAEMVAQGAAQGRDDLPGSRLDEQVPVPGGSGRGNVAAAQPESSGVPAATVRDSSPSSVDQYLARNAAGLWKLSRPVPLSVKDAVIAEMDRRNQEGSTNAAQATESPLPAVPQEARQVASLPAEVVNGQTPQPAPVPNAAAQDQGSDRGAVATPIVNRQGDNKPNPPSTGESPVAQPGGTTDKAITRTKTGKLEISGFTREDITESLKTAKIKATVAVGQDGRVLVSAVGRSGNHMPMTIKQGKAIETALMGKTAKAQKARKFTGNLRNDVNLIAPGLYAEVARGGDGEAMGLNMSLVAEQLKTEGFMLPRTETGKDSDAVIELIRQDIANGGGTLNEARQTKAMTEAEQKAHRADVLRLADEYGIAVKKGVIPRPLTAIEAELKTAIEQEIGLAGKSMATAYDAAIAAGIPQAEADAILDNIDNFYQSEASPDRWVMQYRDQANALQEAIDAHQEREGRDQEGEGTGNDLSPGAGSEGRPGFELTGQTEAELRAEQERIDAAEAQRLKDEQAAENKRKVDAEIGAFNLTGSDRPADTLAAQGQQDIFAAPSPESKTIAEASLGDLLRAAADKADGKVATSEGKEPPASLPSEAAKEVEGSPSEMEKELTALLEKRDQIRAKQMERVHNGEMTRARTTTSNAEVDRVNERIVWLREQIKDAKKTVASATPSTNPLPINVEISTPEGDMESLTARDDRVPQKPQGFVATHKDLFERLRDGNATLDEYKAGFATIADNKDVVMAELAAMTKDKLLEFAGSRYKNDKKDAVIRGAWYGLTGDFQIGRGLSYGMGKDAHDNAIRAMVDGTTQGDIDEYAGAVKAQRDEYSSRLKQMVEAAKDPKTLEDFDDFIRMQKADGMTFAEARMKLTPEQRAEYDRLKGIQSRDERKARADQQKTDIRVAATTAEGQIVETKHTKTGEPLFVVKAAERVERDVYNHWNTTAKRLGGWYSSFRGSGAVPGFQFKTRENADAFLSFIGGNAERAQEAVQARRDAFADDKSQSAVERLNEMAERMEERADESLGRERKENTDRRARMAANAEAAANSEKAMATTMRRIAAAISDGTAQFLDHVRQKAQIEYLTSALRSAQYKELRAKYDSYSEQEKHRGDPVTAETADYAEFPQYTMMRSDLANLARQMIVLPNMKMLGQRVLKAADDTSDAYTRFAKEHLLEVSRFGKADGSGMANFSTLKDAERSIEFSKLGAIAVPLQIKRGEYRIILSPSEAINKGIWKGDDRLMTLDPDVGAEIVEKLGRLNRKTGRRGIDAPPAAPWQFENAYNDRKRLAGMGIEQPWEFRAALREFASLNEVPKERDKIKQMERAMIGRKNDGLDFFPTPASVADELVQAAGIEEGMAVLEPSAGMGHIAERIRAAGVDPDVVEMAVDRRELLEAKGFRLVGSDFMDMTPRDFTYGDVFRAPDGTLGVMRGSGGMGSNRVGLDPLDANGQPEPRRMGWYDRDELEGVEKRAGNSGYDRIIMNPPFSDRRDAEHVQHAYTLLKPGGRLVAIMGEGVFFGQDKKAQAFRDWLEETGGTSEKLEEGAFLDPSLPVNTGVNARMVVVEKPGGSALESRSDNMTREQAEQIIANSRSGGIHTGETVVSIRADLAKSLGKATIDRLEQNGLLRIIDTADSLPDDLTISSTGTALYDGKTAYIIADRTKPAEAIRAALHEIGEHHGLEGMLGEKGYKALTNRVRFMEKAGNARVKEAFAFVRSAYPELREDSPVFMKEILANIGQDSDVRAKPWWQEMIAAVRRFLVKLGYGGLIRTSDIEDMVLYSLRMAARENQSEDSRGMAPAMASKVGAGKTAFKAVDTESAEFKRWFEGSSVTDADGNPLRVYHGTKADFSKFDRSKIESEASFYFTDSPEHAGVYSGEDAEDGGQTMPVFLSMKNPYYIDSMAWNLGDVPGEAALRKLGHDGIVIENQEGGTTYAVFKPTQIKSAVSGTGQFSATNPSILESRQGALPNTGATPPAPPTRQTPMALQGGAPGNRASWNGYEASKLDDLIRTLQDKQIDSKRTVQAIRDAGRKVADKWDVYLQETLFHGRAAKRTLEFVETELNPLTMEVKARGLSMAQLEEFLHARHAEEANALIADRNPDMPDGGSGMTNQQAQDYFAQLDPAMRSRLEAVARRVDAIIANTRKLYVSYGLESQETVDGWADTFKHYVPLMREDKDGGMGIGQGFSVKGKETKSRTGSTRAVVDILANIAMQRERAIVRGEKNRVATALMGLAKLNPNPDFWTFDRVPHEQVFNPKTGLVEDRPDSMFKTRDNVVVAKIPDGRGGIQERAVVFNESNEQAMHMARALKNLDAAQLEGLLGATAKLTRYFASVNTQYNPIFGVTNLVRDVQDAMLNLTSTPIAGHKVDVLKHTLGALRGIYIDTRQMRKGQSATSAYAQLWEEFQHEGGQTGYRDMFRTSADRAAAIEKMIDPHGWTNSPLGKVFTAGGLLKVPLTKAQDIAGPLFDWLSDYNEAMENAVRLAAYKVGKEQGMSNQQAAAMAKGLTVNFNRKGQVGIQAGAIYAFFNASMQGTARIAETLFTVQGNDVKTIRLSSAGQKIVAGGILLGSMQALMLSAMGFSDDEPPEFVRERNTIIPIGGKKYITIPMPLGFAILPNIGRVSTEFVLGGFKNPAKHVARLMGIMADAFNPVGGNGTILQIISPTALDPAVALAENKDWTKKPIAKVSYDKTTPGHKLWKDTASTPGKWIAEAINTMSGGTKHVAGAVSPTPDQIDYLFGQVTGGVGREAVKLEQSIMATATGEDLPPHKIPLVGRFYGDAEAQSSQAATFYSNINRINEYEAEIKGRRKEGRGSEVSAFIAENPEARLVLRANHAERLIQKLRREKHDLVEKGATRGRIKLIETRMKTEMEKFNRAVEASKQRQKEAA